MTQTEIFARAGVADPRLIRDRSYIDGAWVGEGGEVFAVTNPADGAVIGEVASAGEGLARRAVDAAQDAFPGWAGRLPQERGAVLRRWFELVVQAKEDLARIMVLEQGKPLSRGAGRDRLCGVLHRVLRGGGASGRTSRA